MSLAMPMLAVCRHRRKRTCLNEGRGQESIGHVKGMARIFYAVSTWMPANLTSFQSSFRCISWNITRPVCCSLLCLPREGHPWGRLLMRLGV